MYSRCVGSKCALRIGLPVVLLQIVALVSSNSTVFPSSMTGRMPTRGRLISWNLWQPMGRTLRSSLSVALDCIRLPATAPSTLMPLFVRLSYCPLFLPLYVIGMKISVAAESSAPSSGASGSDVLCPGPSGTGVVSWLGIDRLYAVSLITLFLILCISFDPQHLQTFGLESPFAPVHFIHLSWFLVLPPQGLHRVAPGCAS